MREPRVGHKQLINNLTGGGVETLSDDDDKEVIDLGEVDKVVQVSDPHLGYEDANVEDFHTFLTEDVPSMNPDVLLATGDVFEFWRSSIENVLIDFQQEIFDLFNLAESGVDVVLLAGNHDYRFITADAPVEVADHALFQSGGREFRAIHGQEYDPKNANNYTNEALCLTSEATGQIMSDLWDTWRGITPFGALTNRAQFGLPETVSPVGQLAHLNNPDLLSFEEGSARLKLMERTVQDDNEEFVLFGHTHVEKELDEAVNAGSWTKDTNSYVTVEDGFVDLFIYE